MVRFVHQGVGVQSRVYHDSIDEVVYHGSDAIDATKSVVKRGLICLYDYSPFGGALYQSGALENRSINRVSCMCLATIAQGNRRF
jgi:hypothetical protein